MKYLDEKSVRRKELIQVLMSHLEELERKRLKEVLEANKPKSGDGEISDDGEIRDTIHDDIFIKIFDSIMSQDKLKEILENLFKNTVDISEMFLIFKGKCDKSINILGITITPNLCKFLQHLLKPFLSDVNNLVNLSEESVNEMRDNIISLIKKYYLFNYPNKKTECDTYIKSIEREDNKHLLDQLISQMDKGNQIEIYYNNFDILKDIDPEFNTMRYLQYQIGLTIYRY